MDPFEDDTDGHGDSDDGLPDDPTLCIDYYSEIDLVKYTTPEVYTMIDTVSIVTAYIFILGFGFSVVGIANCTTQRKHISAFRYYFMMSFAVKIPVLLFGWLKITSYQYDWFADIPERPNNTHHSGGNATRGNGTHGNGTHVGTHAPPQMCLFFQYGYFILKTQHFFSYLFLIFDRILEQKKPTVYSTGLEAFRPAFILNIFMFMFIVVFIAQYSTIRYKYLRYHDRSECLFGLFRHYCKETTVGRILEGLSTVAEPIFMVTMLLWLGLEMFLKKRRWKKETRFLSKRRDSENWRTLENIALEELDDTSQNDLHRRKDQFTCCQVLRSLYKRKKAPKNSKDVQSILLHPGFNISGNLYDNETEPPAEQELNAITIALCVTDLVFRLPSDIVWSSVIEIPHEDPFMLLLVDVVHLFSHLLPIFICCLTSSQFRREVDSWLFSDRITSITSDLDVDTARNIMENLHHKPTTVFKKVSTRDSAMLLADKYDPYQTIQTVDILSQHMGKSRRHASIFSVLAQAREPPEEAYLERFTTSDLQLSDAALLEEMEMEMMDIQQQEDDDNYEGNDARDGADGDDGSEATSDDDIEEVRPMGSSHWSFKSAR